MCPRQKQHMFQNNVPIHFIKKKIVFCTHMKLAKTRYQDIQDHTGSEGGTERKTWP